MYFLWFSDPSINLGSLAKYIGSVRILIRIESEYDHHFYARKQENTYSNHPVTYKLDTRKPLKPVKKFKNGSRGSFRR